MNEFKLEEGQTSRVEFMFHCGKLSVDLFFDNVLDEDIYTYSYGGKISNRGPQYCDPPEYECYMTTYENVDVVFLASGQEVEKEAFAKMLGISIENLDKLVEKLEQEAEPLFLAHWEPLYLDDEDYH